MKPKRKKMISLYTKMFTKSANSFNYNQGDEIYKTNENIMQWFMRGRALPINHPNKRYHGEFCTLLKKQQRMSKYKNGRIRDNDFRVQNILASANIAALHGFFIIWLFEFSFWFSYAVLLQELPKEMVFSAYTLKSDTICPINLMTMHKCASRTRQP